MRGETAKRHLSATRQQSNFRCNIVHALKRSAASKPAWFFAATWLASVIVLVAGGHRIPVGGIMVGFLLLLLSLMVVGAVAGPALRRVWVLLGLLMVFITLTAWNDFAFHKVIDGNADIALWTPLVEWLHRLGEQCFGEGSGNFVATPVKYVLIRLIALLAVARLPSQGFVKGHREGLSLLICCALPVIWLAFTLIEGNRRSSGCWVP